MSEQTPTQHESPGARVAALAERRWAVVCVLSLAVFVVVAAFAGIHRATMPQAAVETVSPIRLHLDGEFVETNLGSAVEPDGSVTVLLVALND